MSKSPPFLRRAQIGKRLDLKSDVFKLASATKSRGLTLYSSSIIDFSSIIDSEDDFI
jgi:hypothetical protein